jgi:hypothetical protein
MLDIAHFSPDGRQIIRDGLAHNLAAATTDAGRNQVIRTAHSTLPGFTNLLQGNLQKMNLSRAFSASVQTALYGKPQRRQAKRY